LSVGVSLDVTPFINPDGLVVMDIDQEIDDLDGSTPIEGVGNVPNTTKRTLQSEIAVKDKDTVMLGGFIRSEKDHTKNGIPYLQDIPFLGNLFTARTDNKDRKETIVLIRPTVLRTPDIAAAQAVAEQKRLPGISAAAAEDEYDERRQVDAEAKAEQKREDAGKGRDDNFFLPVSPRGMVSTNNAAPLNP
jgi:general secretion pathway protein D